MRDNVVISLYLNNTNLLLFNKARLIDNSILKGKNGVSRGKKVRIPRWLKDESNPRSVKQGKSIEFEVSLDSIGAGDGIWNTVDSIGVPSSRERTGYIKEPKKYSKSAKCRIRFRAPPKINKTSEIRSIWVCYATSGCVVVTKKIQILIIP